MRRLTKTDVEASLKILNIMNVDEIASSFTIMFELQLNWNDLHLTFNFLKEDTRQILFHKIYGISSGHQISYILITNMK